MFKPLWKQIKSSRMGPPGGGGKAGALHRLGWLLIWSLELMGSRTVSALQPSSYPWPNGIPQWCSQDWPKQLLYLSGVSLPSSQRQEEAPPCLQVSSHSSKGHSALDLNSTTPTLIIIPLTSCSQPERILPLEDIWQCLEKFLLVTTTGKVLQASSRGHDATKPIMHGTVPLTKYYLAKMSIVLRVGNPVLITLQFSKHAPW